MQKNLMMPVLLTIALSACGQKEEPQTVAAPEAPPAAEAPAPAPAPMETATPAEAPATEAAAPAMPAQSAAAPAAAPAPAKPAPAPAAATPAPETAAPAPAMSGSPEGAKKYASTCASCHGPKGQGIGTFPKLAGLTADTVKSRLADYKAGKQVGPMSGVMMPIASPLSGTEVDALAAHIASLK